MTSNLRVALMRSMSWLSSDSMMRPISVFLSGLTAAASDGVGLMDETASVALPSCADASTGNSAVLKRPKQRLRKEEFFMAMIWFN